MSVSGRTHEDFDHEVRPASVTHRDQNAGFVGGFHSLISFQIDLELNFTF